MDYGMLRDYEETQDIPMWLKALLTALPFIIGGSAVVMILSHVPPRGMGYGMAALAVAMAWMAWLFRKLTITIGGGILGIDYGPAHPRIKLENIEWIAREPITLGRYGGIGIRMGAGAVCYNTRFGEGVRIHVRDRKQDVVFTTDNPDRVALALGQQLRTGG